MSAHFALSRYLILRLARQEAFGGADMWVDADDYVEVWGESNSICGVIEDECEELTVALYPSGRFRFFSIGWCRFSRFRWWCCHHDRAPAGFPGLVYRALRNLLTLTTTGVAGRTRRAGHGRRDRCARCIRLFFTCGQGQRSEQRTYQQQTIHGGDVSG